MFQHHPSVTPGAIIGYRKSGTPIRLIAGGSGEGEDGTVTGQEGAPAGDGSAGTGQDEGTGGTGSHGDTGHEGTGTNAAGDDDRHARTIAAIREDFKAERARRQATEKALTDFRAETEAREKARADAEAERNRKLAIALGVAPEDEPPDPAKLAEELERTRTQHQAALSAKEAEIRQRDIRLAVLTQAPALEANGALLMDSLSFLRKVEGLDPAAGDFSEQLGEAIKAAAEANPNYKLTAPRPSGNGNGGKPRGDVQPARSGGEFNGAPGGNRQWTLADVEAASAADVVKAQDAGLLMDLGYAPRKKAR